MSKTSGSGGDDAASERQELTMHQANAKNAGKMRDSAEERRRLLEATVESELNPTVGSTLFGDDLPDELDNLAAKDFPLANFDEQEDTHEFKWIQEILAEFKRAQYPHPGSGVQGPIRAWAADDSTAMAEAMDVGDYIAIESFLLGTYSRATRGEEGMQQEVNAKSIQESHAISEREGSSKGRIRSKIPGL